MTTNKLTLEEFKARRLAVLAEESAHFRANWKWIALEAVQEFGYGVLLGAALGLSLVVWAFGQLLGA